MNTNLLKSLWRCSKLNIDIIREDIAFFNSFPNIETVRKFWNITETSFFKKIKNIKFEKIPINMKFYIDFDYLAQRAVLKDSLYSSKI